MPDLGPNKRVVRSRPVMVVLRGYDPTQPNKTSFSAPPKTYTSTDAQFIYSGMVVTRDADGLLVPAVNTNMKGDTNADGLNRTPATLGWAFQDSNRFDVVNARLANCVSGRSDVEIRTAWFDRSQVYKLDDPLCVGTTPGELTLQTNDSTQLVVGRVSALPKFEGGNPKIGNVNYTYVSALPTIPASAGLVAPAAASASTAIATDMAAFTVATDAWVVANVTVANRPAGYPFTTAGVTDTSTGDAGLSGPNATAYNALKTKYDLAAAYVTAQIPLRQAASDVSSFQATDNSMLTFVVSR